MSRQYSPFNKNWDQLSTSDLNVLRTTHEGWYVEYKKAIPNAQAIAKSVSAFANTYGGYLFFGIDELTKENNVAGSFPGIPATEVPAMRERIRQAIAAHSSPPPHFEIKTFPGPCEDLDLSADCAILGVHIPQSARAPHVHKSGIIYRRVADSSEPTAENDRHALGELFKRSDALLNKYKAWYDADPDFLEQEKRHPYLRLLLVPDPWGERKPWLELPKSEVRKLFVPDDKQTTLPFDTIHCVRNEFVARQTIGNRLDSMTLTWALRRDLTSEILVPIPAIRPVGDRKLRIELDGYNQEQRFLQMIEGRLHEDITILDLNQLLPIFMGIFETFNRISSAAGWNDSAAATLKILNADRSCPFIDVSHVMDRYEKHGIPITLNLMSPLREGHHPENFIDLSPDMAEGEPWDPSISGIRLMMHVAWAFGLPMWESKDDIETDLYEQLLGAGERSMKAQALRNGRK